MKNRLIGSRGSIVEAAVLTATPWPTPVHLHFHQAAKGSGLN